MTNFKLERVLWNAQDRLIKRAKTGTTLPQLVNTELKILNGWLEFLDNFYDWYFIVCDKRPVSFKLYESYDIWF